MTKTATKRCNCCGGTRGTTVAKDGLCDTCAHILANGAKLTIQWLEAVVTGHRLAIIAAKKAMTGDASALTDDEKTLIEKAYSFWEEYERSGSVYGRFDRDWQKWLIERYPDVENCPSCEGTGVRRVQR